MAETQGEVQPPAVEETDALWAEWRERRSPEARELLVERYRELVRILAAKAYRHRYSEELEFSDYFQFGMVGLLESIDRFDPAYGAKFETYATHRVQGAILNGAESLSEKQRQIAVRSRVRAERAKLLADEQLSESGRAPEALQRLADVAVGLALGLLLDNAGLYLDGDPATGNTPYEQVELSQLRRRLVGLVESLPEAERRVIRWHYYQHMQFDEIAHEVGVTKGRISQIHHSALKRLRALHEDSSRFSGTL
jgi:RNA polymerase sigma factor for flagellar operon FliA